MMALLVLLLAAPAPAQNANSGRGAQEAPDHKQRFEEDPRLPKDQGWRQIGVGGSPYRDDGSASVSPDPVPTLEAEDVRENVLTLLETHLARTGGRWVVVDPKTKRERSLKLAGLGALKETKPGHFAGRASFRDAAGVLQAELLARVGGASWRILSLEPAGAKKPAAKKKPEPRPDAAAQPVEPMAADAPYEDPRHPVAPPPKGSPPPALMSAPEPGR